MFSPTPQNRHKRWYHMLSVGQRKLWALGIVCAVLLVVGLSVVAVYSVRAAAYDISLVGKGLRGSVLYDSQHRMAAMLSEHEDAPVAWEELPEKLINAFVAREDAHFFDHGGVVYTSFIRSLLRNMSSMRYKQGGSTITMQLTRNVFELQGKTLDRKLLEIALTQRVESHYDKHAILCQYLSRIYFGQSCYGVREAARYYFGKPVGELELHEAALLAGIVRAPSLYNPNRSLRMAQQVRRETLQRMLELEMISQEEFDEADAAELAPGGSNAEPGNAGNYPALWANAELENLPEVQGEQGQGMSVVSHLNLELQQYLELAVQKAAFVIETPSPLPDEWMEQEGAEGMQRFFSTAQRPKWLRAPGQAQAAGQATLQCCAIVVDARMNRRGNVLAVVGGRDASDRVDRWQGRLEPGRAAAPLVFCCACLPGGGEHHIVSHSAQVTGSRLGYGVVRTFFDSLGLTDTQLPDAEHEDDLYEGHFSLRRIELARLLFDLQNMGKGYELGLISTVWSQGQHLLYSKEQDTTPEYIRRESAVAVAHLPPFRYREGEPVTLHEELPEQGGYWTMVCNDRGVAVFVWMGLEGAPGEQAPKMTPELRRLVSLASQLMARDVHTAARRELRAAPAPPPATATPTAP